MGGTWSNFMGGVEESVEEMLEFRDVLDGAEDCRLADEEVGLARRALEERLLPRNDHWHSENSVLTKDLPSGFRYLYYVYTDWCFRQFVGITSIPELPRYLAKSELVRCSIDKVEARFHRGFLLLAMELYHELKELAQAEIPLTLSGFGGGGAVAAIVGALLKADGFNVSEVYTYGQPMFTDGRGAALFDASGIKLYRVKAEGDPLPQLPLESDGFAHCGAEVALLDGPRFAFRPQRAAAAAASLARSQAPPSPVAAEAVPDGARRAWADLTGHKQKLALYPLSEYVRLIRGKLENAVRASPPPAPQAQGA
eukprot:tig00021433_g21260.t1